MNITARRAHASEIPAFIELSGDDKRNAGTREYLASLLEKNCTRPEWCFVAELNGQPVGCAVLWTLPDGQLPSDIVLLEAPWEAPDMAVGLTLLRTVFAFAYDLGATELGHVVDLPAQPPQFQRQPEARAALLQRAGFTLARDGYRFRWQARGDLPPPDPRLQFRSHAELGREPFIDLLADLLEETADARLGEEVAQLGARKAAELLFDNVSELEHEPEWFEIGYTADGRPAAVSLPARNPTSSVIGFVGVSRIHRGLGYSAAIVARGTYILAKNGATEILGDCDTANIAMVKGFQRCGYQNFARRREFIRKLTHTHLASQKLGSLSIT